MLESLFGALCKIGTLFKFTCNRMRSPGTKTSASVNRGSAAATSGDNSPVHIGDNYVHTTTTNGPTAQSESEIETKARFKRRLIAVANELPFNFRNRGNIQSPFLTQALEKLVHDEPMIHSDLELFQKASHCLYTAQTLSTAAPYHPTLKPGGGQHLMKDLAEYISDKYDIKGTSQP